MGAFSVSLVRSWIKIDTHGDEATANKNDTEA
jgi:hypothetical protein